MRPPAAVPSWLLAASARGAAGREREIDLVIEGVTPLAEPGSLRAAIVETGLPATQKIIAVRSALHVPESTAEPGRTAARVEGLTNRLARLSAEAERLQQQRRKLARSIPDPALRTTSLVEKVDERIRDALATAGLLHDAQGRIDRRLGELDRELADLKLNLAAAELEHSQARSQESAGSGQPTRRVTIRISVGDGALPELLLTYAVPAARFWPLYTLRIVEGRDAKESARRATWVIEAQVAQRTGEDWREVRLGLSTADLLLDARLPELPSLRLGRAQPPARRGYRPPPAGLDELFAGYDRHFRDAGSGKTRLLQEPLVEPMPAEFAKSGGAIDEILETTAPAGEEAESPRDLRIPEPQALYSSASVVVSAPPPGSPPLGRSQGMPAMSFGAANSAPPPPAMQAAAPARARRLSSAPRAGGGPSMEMAKKERELATTLSDGVGGGGYGAPAFDDADESGLPGPVEPGDTWLDFDRLVLGGPDDRMRRGRLGRVAENLGLGGARQANEQIERLRPDGGLVDPLTSRGHFDHRYDAEGLVLVPSDGLPHRVAVSHAETLPSLRLLTVPRERPEVYREAELKNPTEAPLLAGPVDVYVEGSLLTTAAIQAIDRGGALHVGMGVEERVRVARNVRADEENVGILGGSTQMTHHVGIELSSALGQQAVVEVFERLPVSDDKAVTVELLSARPEPKEYTQAERGAPVRGGLVWRLLLPPGGKAKIDYSFRILFPARTEIVGGNRRD